MAIDKEVTDRFDALDAEIKMILDAVTTTTEVVSAMQAAIVELQEDEPPSRHALYVPGWLLDGPEALA
jgi:hypothetical protein